MNAILSKDKLKLKKVIQKCKPEKWVSLEVNYEDRTIKYKDQFITREMIKAILAEIEKDYELKLIVLSFGPDPKPNDEYWDFIENEKELSFKLC